MYIYASAYKRKKKKYRPGTDSDWDQWYQLFSIVAFQLGCHGCGIRGGVLHYVERRYALYEHHLWDPYFRLDMTILHVTQPSG